MIKISAEVAIEVLTHAGVPDERPALVVDANYVLPSEAWLLKDFAEELAKYHSTLRLFQWINDVNDCDNFARRAATFAADWHARTSPNSVSGLAFGQFHYIREDGAGHAINFAILPRPDFINGPGVRIIAEDLQVLFFEPQLPPHKVILSEWEISACIGYYL